MILPAFVLGLERSPQRTKVMQTFVVRFWPLREKTISF
jgi:hypothetical protein